MTQPPSPSAAALEAAKTLIAQLQHEPVDPLDDDIVPTALALDVFAAQAAEAARNPCDKIFSHKWLSMDCVDRGCQAPAAERAKPAASDHEAADEIAKFAKEIVFVFDDDLARISKRIAAALAERGRVERERCESAAIWAIHDAGLPIDNPGKNLTRREIMAKAVTTAIRNQTTNDEA